MSTNSAWNAEYNNTKGALLVGNNTRPVVEPVGADGFVLTADSSLATGVKWATGFNPAATSAFYAGISAPILNVTGNGANYSAIFDTIVFQNGTGYNAATGIFTAPVSGVYQFNTAVSLSAIGGAMTAGNLTFLYNGGTVVSAAYYNPFAEQNLGGPAWGDDLVVTYEMTAGDTMQVEVQVAGGPGNTITFGIVGATFFAGYLVSTSGGISGIFGPGASTDRAIATWNGITGSAQYDNPTTRITAAGEMTNTGQPAFRAHISADVPAFIGGTLPCDVEDFDQGSDYNPVTFLFTAPVSGRYFFNTSVTYSTLVLFTLVNISFDVNGATYQQGSQVSPTAVNGLGVLGINSSAFIQLTAGDTVNITMTHNGGGSGTLLGVAGVVQYCVFEGYLVC